MINTTLCYIQKDNKYLMLRRDKKKKDLNALKWIGVGGKFEPGETAEECLLREVYEETGLTLTSYIFVGMIKFESDIYEAEDMYLFRGTDFTGELTSECEEGTLEWVDEDKVLDLPTWEGDKYFLKPMLEGKTNLNMTVCYEGDKLVDFIDETAPVMFDSSSLISSPHGFSTRIGGVSSNEFKSLNLRKNCNDVPERVMENWRRFLDATGIGYRPFVSGKQVHGNYVHIAAKKDANLPYGESDPIEADGYVTNEKYVPLVAFTADCVPVLMEDPKAGVIGAVHSGWRGTVADIGAEAVKQMVSLGATAENIRVAIGPAIDRCCFEVGPEVIEAVINLIGPDEAEGFYSVMHGDKYMLDLRGVVKQRFVQIGVPEQNIELIGECTKCHPDRYYSHRNTGDRRGSLAAVIMLD